MYCSAHRVLVVNNCDSVASKVGWLVNNELERAWNGTFIAYFDVVSRNLHEGLEKTVKTLRIFCLRTRDLNPSLPTSKQEWYSLGSPGRFYPLITIHLLVYSIFTIVQLYFWLTTVSFVMLYDITSTVRAAYSSLSWSNSPLSRLSIYQVSGHLQSDPFTFSEVVCKSKLRQISCGAEYERPPSSDKFVNCELYRFRTYNDTLTGAVYFMLRYQNHVLICEINAKLQHVMHGLLIYDQGMGYAVLMSFLNI
jgi:hypothetical protein